MQETIHLRTILHILVSVTSRRSDQTDVCLLLYHKRLHPLSYCYIQPSVRPLKGSFKPLSQSNSDCFLNPPGYSVMAVGVPPFILAKL